jgi:hypothetical protein
MAIRRTAPKHDSQTQASKPSFTYRLPTMVETEPGKSENQISAPHKTAATTFGYPVHFIYRDLVKTVFISVLTMLILVGITFALRR